MEAPAFGERLLAWYDAHRRDLPWRRDRDPYRVWLSEIMLQQTRVAAVIEHYQEFLSRFPNVRKLAAAREANVLAAWSGLGYYRRARMMHAAAKVIVRQRNGAFPTTAKEWEELAGVGRYTAAAIASIVFDEPVAVVDGNVERVLQRSLGRRIIGQDLWNSANCVLDRKRPGDFNQAMMELGATICTSKAPSCLVCPIREFCSTCGELPLTGRAARQNKREIHYVLDVRNGYADNGKGGVQVFIVQRPQTSSLMPGMWELPEATGKAKAGKPAIVLRHSITVTDYRVRVWRERVRGSYSGDWVPAEKLNQVALTGLARKILRAANIFRLE
jgi:A/G-specific adenine glycosylase